MITIRARNFRGVEKADVIVDPIALVAGPNATGKSSLAMAAAALLTGDALPLPGLHQGSAGFLVRTGAPKAAATIEGPAGIGRIDWPECAIKSDRTPPAASPIAAGLVSVAYMTAQERARKMAEFLHSEPTRAELVAELGDDAADIDAVWDAITAKGWDGAYSARRSHGAELKGRWRQITSQIYGSRVAATWRPDLAEIDEHELVLEIERLTAARDRAIGAAAVSAADRERWELDANDLERRERLAAEASEKVHQAERDLDAARADRAALGTDEHLPEMPCPHCGGYLVIRRVSLMETRLEVAPPKPSESERKAHRLEVAGLDGTVDRMANELRSAIAQHSECQRTLLAARDAVARLAAAPPVAESDVADAEVARAALARSEARLVDYRRKIEADDIHAQIGRNDRVLEVLNADGLRAKKLARVVELWNEADLARLSHEAGWREVSMTSTFALEYGGRPYGLLSASEQYRVRVVLQVAMALRDGSQMVVIDAADILDASERSGLFAMIFEAARIPALVCMTLTRESAVPDLGKAGMGRSYWIAGGVADEIGIEAAAA